MNLHLDNYCLGIKTISHHLQKMFYLPRAWSTIQKILLEFCVPCKLRRAKKVTAPIPDLMLCRHPDGTTRCFSICYYDLAGPFHILDNKIDRKMYYLLVTCASSRASHIEMVASKNTNDILNALKCFFGRRGYPTMMISDQEAGFIRASKEIKRILDTKDKRKNIVSELASLGVVFKFNHSHSPQLQSLAERLHRIVKKRSKF